jgi:thioredoxin 1
MATNTKNIVNLSSSNFKQEVENSNVPILVDFWAPWCGPCRAVAPVLEQLVSKYDGKLKIGKVNVDEEQELAVNFRVMSIPTLILFKDGKALQQMVGFRSPQDVENMVLKAL